MLPINRRQPAGSSIWPGAGSGVRRSLIPAVGMLRAWNHPASTIARMRRYVISGEAIQFSPFQRGGVKSPSSKTQQRRMKSATLTAVSTQVRSRVMTNVACRSMHNLLVAFGEASIRPYIANLCALAERVGPKAAKSRPKRQARLLPAPREKIPAPAAPVAEGRGCGPHAAGRAIASCRSLSARM